MAEETEEIITTENNTTKKFVSLDNLSRFSGRVKTKLDSKLNSADCATNDDIDSIFEEESTS